MGEGRELIQELGLKIPELRSLIYEHVEYFGELLPHVLLGDISRWAELNSVNPENHTKVAELVSIFDQWFLHGDLYAKNLVMVSFLENLSAQSMVVRMLSRSLRSAYDGHDD